MYIFRHIPLCSHPITNALCNASCLLPTSCAGIVRSSLAGGHHSRPTHPWAVATEEALHHGEEKASRSIARAQEGTNRKGNTFDI